MKNLFSTVSRIALVAAGAYLLQTLPVLSADVTVPPGGSLTTPVTVSGSDKVTVGANGSFITSAPSTAGPITWDWATASPDVVITNEGTIRSEISNRSAITATGTGGTAIARSLKIDNKAGAEISTVSGDALRFTGSFTGSLIIDNAGEISADKGGQAIDLKDLNPADGSTVVINNLATGLITGSAGQDVLRPGNKTIINNAGKIIHKADAVGQSGGDGVDFQDMRGSTLNNLSGGYIEASRHGVTGDRDAVILNEANATIKGRNGSGINWDNEDADVVKVTNYGKVIGTAVVNSPDGDGDGIDVDGQLVLDNYGEVIGEQAYGFHDGQLNSADGIAAGGGTINNFAGGRIYGRDRGILIDDSEGGTAPFATKLTNQGLIEASNGAAVTFIGDRDDVISNKGTIRGGTDSFGNHVAIAMGGGDDELNIYGGSIIDGEINGGEGGSDSILLRGLAHGAASDSGTLANVRNVEQLSVQSGVWTLTDDQVYDSTFITNGATVKSDHLLIGRLILDNGRFEGNATVTELQHLNPTSAVVPGGDGAFGTITVQQDSQLGGRLLIDANAAGQSDKLVTNGTLALVSGWSVEVNAQAGNYAPETVYTIATSANALEWQAGTVSDNFAFLDSALSHDANNVFLTLSRNDTEFWDVAETGNQSSVAEAIAAAAASPAPGWVVYNEIVGSTPEEARAAYDLLSGEAHADGFHTLIVQSGLVMDTLLSRLDGVFGKQPGSGNQQALRMIEPASDVQMSGDEGSALSLWAQGFGQWLDADGDGNAADLDGDLYGGLAGLDYQVDNWVVGIAGGYAEATSDIDERRSSIDTGTALLAAYTGLTIDAIRFKAGASYGFSDIDSERTAIVGDIVERPEASYDGETVNVFGELAYAFDTSAGVIMPFAGLAYTKVSLDGFSEDNAPNTGLVADDQSFDALHSTAGLRLAGSFGEDDGIRARGMIGWRHAYDDLAPELALTFQASGTGFTVEGLPIAEDSAIAEAGIDMRVGSSASIGVTYHGSFAEDVQTHAASVMGRVSF